MSARAIRYTARLVALLWACWWVFFETAEAAGSGPYGQAIFFAVAMLGAVVVAWRWELIGGILLVAEGIGAILLFSGMWMRNFQLAGFALLFGIMCAPPIVAGTLIVISGRRPAGRAAAV